ncbi:hypothetical protein FUAX_43200 (plasmid) [Fulvitalea axinellae]|uniref:Por secretion system C-terminal sorting domain-containing protein n=1 Tax=Fulvitalea axinellae TaxID=1182444 RepID=A0AAU9D798_9BACT|nr:hypothetical protein FUAX_43200 [Fulvitalea axinellae]
MKKRITPLLLMVLMVSLLGQAFAQDQAPFQMPANGNEANVYSRHDFYHFSALAWDSQNRPYGFNANKEFGYIRTLRDGLWKNINYLDELSAQHPGATVTTAEPPSIGHANPRLCITSDNHLYLTLNYKVNGSTIWSLLYLDDLDSENFQVIPLNGYYLAHVEEFTGHNLKNGETPAVILNRGGQSFADLGWDPWKKYPWTVGGLTVIDVAIPYRNSDGTISLNTFTLSETAGAATVHSGGNGVMATIGDKTYLAYTRFDKDKVANNFYQGKNDTRNANQGYVVEITRPVNSTGTPVIKEKFLALQFPFDAIDGHSQGELILDTSNRLRYISGDHVHSDRYYRSVHAVTDPAFDLTNTSEWTYNGTVTPTGAQDFSYETAVIDNSGNMHVAYRQRASSLGIQRGLYYKSLPASSTNWPSGYGRQLLAPPAPYNTNAAYMILYHRVWIDKSGKVHFSSTFYEGDSGANGVYPRIAGFRGAGSGDGIWTESDRYRYLENIIGGKSVQKLSFSISDQELSSSPITLNATSDASGTTIEYELVDGPATLSGNQLTLNGQGSVTVKAKALGNAAFYSDEVTVTFQVADLPGIVPEADAFIRDGGSASTNYGTSTRLAVKKDGTGWNRKALLRFDLSGVSSTISKATLRMVPVNSGNTIGQTQIRAMAVADDTWSESGLTWANQPATGQELDSKTGSPAATEWDVTAFAEAQRTGDGKMSIMFESTVIGSESWIGYNSREATDTSLRPMLILSAGEEQNITAAKDSFVQDGGSANTNYGGGTGLIVKKDGLGYQREIFLQFDLSSTQGQIVEAKLKMATQATGSTAGSTNLEALFVGDDSWLENTINWNNRPAKGASLATSLGNAGTVEWDVTAQAEIERAGDGTLSISVRSNDVGSGNWLNFLSKEGGTAENAPTLVIRTGSGTVARTLSTVAEDLNTKQETSLAIYPNPASDKLTVKGDFEAEAQGIIYSQAGQRIRTIQLSDYTNTVDISGFGRGIYVIRIFQGSGARTFRFVKR